MELTIPPTAFMRFPISLLESWEPSFASDDENIQRVQCIAPNVRNRCQYPPCAFCTALGFIYFLRPSSQGRVIGGAFNTPCLAPGT